ncbi:unnamed protein product, partial [marine sediment metagenome]
QQWEPVRLGLFSHPQVKQEGETPYTGLLTETRRASGLI